MDVSGRPPKSRPQPEDELGKLLPCMSLFIASADVKDNVA